MSLPDRIVCLTSETVEVLYALGEEHRIVGVTGYATIPPRVRKEKPKVWAFASGKLDKVLAVKPDLALAFSDLQADLCRDLIKAGIAVHCFNQRDVAGILDMITTVGRLVGAQAKAEALVAELQATIAATRAAAAQLQRRPRVWIEEWDEPLIGGIRWAAELVEIAGGELVAPELHAAHAARERFADPARIAALAPDMIIGSWCGKRFVPDHVSKRPGWQDVPAVRNGALYEIKSAILLAPGPAVIREALPAVAKLIAGWAVR
jgi:iron complex transport system substrate-binding protein